LKWVLVGFVLFCFFFFFPFLLLLFLFPHVWGFFFGELYGWVALYIKVDLPESEPYLVVHFAQYIQ
jgi:hypothetical protein